MRIDFFLDNGKLEDDKTLVVENKNKQSTFNFELSFSEDISTTNDLLIMLMNKLNKEGFIN